MIRVKRFIETAGIYLIGNALSKLIGFFLLPLYTGRLPPEEFGLYDLTVTVVSLTVPVVFFQVWDGMFRYAFEKQDAREKYGIVSNSFVVCALGFAAYPVLFAALGIFFDGFTWYIFLYGLAVALQYQYAFMARAFLRNRLFVVSGLLNSIVNAAANLVLILKFGMGIQSLYIAFIAGCMAQILMIELSLHPLRHFSIKQMDKTKIADMLKFSVPMCVSTVLYWLLSGYTKVAVSQQLGTYANGLYAVANKFTSLMMFLITVLQYAWNETAYLMARDDNRREGYEKCAAYIMKAAFLGSGIFILFTKLVFGYFVDDEYSEALIIVPLSTISVALNAFISFIDTIFMAEKQTRLIFMTTITGACINVAALWIFTPVWGLQGAIGGLCLSYTVMLVLRVYVLRNRFAIKLKRSYLIYLPVLAAAICVFYTVDNVLYLAALIALICWMLAYSLLKALSPVPVHSVLTDIMRRVNHKI